MKLTKEDFIIGRDLIPTAIFTILLIVAKFILEMVSALHPMIYLLGSIVSSVIAFPIFTLWLLKVRKIGTILVSSTIIGFCYFIMGGSYICIIIWVPMAIVMEVVRVILKNKQMICNGVLYSLYVVTGTISCFVPMLVMKEEFFDACLEMGMTSDYLDVLRDLVSNQSFMLFTIISVVVGFVFGIVGYITFKSKFENAGLVGNE